MDLENTKVEILKDSITGVIEILNSNYLFKLVPIVDFETRGETRVF